MYFNSQVYPLGNFCFSFTNQLNQIKKLKLFKDWKIGLHKYSSKGHIHSFTLSLKIKHDKTSTVTAPLIAAANIKKIIFGNFFLL